MADDEPRTASGRAATGGAGHGLSADGPRSRDIVYKMMRLRALRRKVDAKLAPGPALARAGRGVPPTTVAMDRAGPAARRHGLLRGGARRLRDELDALERLAESVARASGMTLRR